MAAHIRPPWWTLVAITEISPLNKENAGKTHLQRLRQISTRDLIIYTDGSGYNGHIGATIYSPTISVTKGNIWVQTTHNVYAAELMTIQMAVILYEEKIDDYSNAYIFTDNQSAIQKVDSSKRPSGQCIFNKIDRIHEIKPTCIIHNEWVTGHMNIEVNEQADHAANAIAISNITPSNIRMKSAQNRSIQTMAQTEWETEWENWPKERKTPTKYEPTSRHHHWNQIV